MAEKINNTITDLTNIKISDICGLWDVIRICEADKKVLYPWDKERFLFNFLDEKNVFMHRKWATFSWHMGID